MNNNITKPRILCVVGSTASGKTSLAVELARQLDGEIVSCDSMQIYRGMNIGTATPDEAELTAMLEKLKKPAAFFEKVSGKYIGVCEVYRWSGSEVIERK